MEADVLALTRVTKDVGATIKPGPMVVAAPGQTMTDEMLAEVGAGSGLNGPFLADLVVAMATHENTSIATYRVLQEVVVNPMLRSTFAAFEQDAVAAVGVHAKLMEALGIPMYYISPAARLTEGLDSKMVMSLLTSGSADQLTIDMKAVEIVLLGSTMCVDNTNLLAAMADRADEPARSALMDAVRTLSGPQVAHLEWARETRQRMALTMLDHPVAHKLLQFAETAIAKLRGTSA